MKWYEEGQNSIITTENIDKQDKSILEKYKQRKNK